ncbi:UNKNOWN [Stylonychia lemnae]|uniref:RAP domain-containing protein n=1 Tax=Stylonychia lemnae TaxID=5949 RepID=A0A078AKQ1_STYLE|nr:UNKNOWN [Stylonychia lemnae]|eukprot:CDW82945.1 UNKNOWN [Stylonychia lemnae]
MKQFDPDVMDFITKNIDSFNVKQTNSVLYLYAINGFDAQYRFEYSNFLERLIDKAIEKAKKQKSQYYENIQSELNISRSLGSLGFRNDKIKLFLKQVVDKIQQSENYTFHNYLTPISAIINLRYFNEFYGKNHVQVVKNFIQLYHKEQHKSTQLFLELITLARQLTKLEIYDYPLIFELTFNEIKEVIESGRILHKNEITGIYQLLVSLRIEKPEYLPNIDFSRIIDFDLLQETFKSSTINMYNKHNLNNRIKKYLEDNDIKYIEEYFDDFFLDFYLPDYNTIIENNGPYHYIAPERILNQTTYTKLRQIKKKGYNLIEVPFYVNMTFDDGFKGPRLEDLLDNISNLK